jgi:NAD(P)-dependent dehydrogenase (short-subunit alcohol dehydrogenase family)
MKTVIITGANGGLGTAVVKKFLNRNYRVLATVIHESMLTSLDKHENLEVYHVDLVKEKETATFVSEMVLKHKTIEGALMIAGGFAAGGIEQTGNDELMKMYSLNFETAYHIARPVFLHMIQHNYGRLIFVGARPALDATAGKKMIPYALSKSLVIKLAELLNAEAKGKNVTATVFIPSTIDTPANRAGMPDANFTDWVKPEQLANLMEAFCSDLSDPVREAVIKVYANA